MPELTYDQVLQFIYDRVENAEDNDDWDGEADSYCNMLYDDLVSMKEINDDLKGESHATCNER